MKTTLVAYATDNFSVAVDTITRSALRHGVDEVRIWDPAALRATEFYRRNQAMLAFPHGAGYWLWKPYIILDALERLEGGAALVYSDVGVRLVSSVAPVVELCRQMGGILVFDGRGHYIGYSANRARAKTWTKRDCFLVMGCDEPAFHDAPMIDGAFQVFINSARSRKFVAEWLEACCDPRALTGQENELGKENLPGFIGHLHDQSVLTLLAKKHDLRGFRCPSQYGNHCKPEALRVADESVRRPYGQEGIDHDSPYPTVFHHHRMRDFPLEQMHGLLVERLGDRLPQDLETGSALTLVDIVLQLMRLWTPPARMILTGPDAQRAVIRACATLVDTRLVLWLEGATPETCIPEIRALLSQPGSGNQLELLTAPMTDPTTWSRLVAEGIDAILSSLPVADVPLPAPLLGAWSSRPFLCAWDAVDEGGEDFRTVLQQIRRRVGRDVVALHGLVPAGPDDSRAVGVIGRLPL